MSEKFDSASPLKFTLSRYNFPEYSYSFSLYELKIKELRNNSIHTWNPPEGTILNIFNGKFNSNPHLFIVTRNDKKVNSFLYSLILKRAFEISFELEANEPTGFGFLKETLENTLICVALHSNYFTCNYFVDFQEEFGAGPIGDSDQVEEFKLGISSSCCDFIQDTEYFIVGGKLQDQLAVQLVKWNQDRAICYEPIDLKLNTLKIKQLKYSLKTKLLYLLIETKTESFLNVYFFDLEKNLISQKGTIRNDSEVIDFKLENDDQLWLFYGSSVAVHDALDLTEQQFINLSSSVLDYFPSKDKVFTLETDGSVSLKSFSSDNLALNEFSTIPSVWFELKTENFPYLSTKYKQLVETRQEFGFLFFDLLFECVSNSSISSLYPPKSFEHLTKLVNEIIKLDCDSLKKHCLIYFLLQDRQNESHLHFANRFLVPLNFCNLIDGYWAMDNYFFDSAVDSFTKPNVLIDFQDKIIQVLLNNQEFELILKLNLKVQDKVLLQIKFQVDFNSSFIFQRETGQFSRFLTLCFKEINQEKLTKLVSCPFNDQEQDQLIEFIKSSVKSDRSAILMDFLLVFLIVRGKFYQACEYFEQNEFPSSLLVNEQAQDFRRNLIEQTRLLLTRSQREKLKSFKNIVDTEEFVLPLSVNKSLRTQGKYNFESLSVCLDSVSRTPPPPSSALKTDTEVSFDSSVEQQITSSPKRKRNGTPFPLKKDIVFSDSDLSSQMDSPIKPEADLYKVARDPNFATRITPLKDRYNPPKEHVQQAKAPTLTTPSRLKAMSIPESPSPEVAQEQKDEQRRVYNLRSSAKKPERKK